MASERLAAVARQLLDASALCAIATVAAGNRAHVNTAYFAWSAEFDVVWLSDPSAQHSRNLAANEAVAIAVYDSTQAWEKPDRGIQLFGSGREAEGAAAHDSATLYGDRFPEYRASDLSAYRLYRFRPDRVKLFDEQALGAGVFVTAGVAGKGRLVWERTEVYRSSP